MAKDDSKSRVFKKNDVHKRRVEKKSRAKTKKSEGVAAEGKVVADLAARETASPVNQGEPASKDKAAAKARPSVKGKPVAEGKAVASLTSSLTAPIGAPVAEGSDEVKPAVSPAAQTRPIVAPSKESFSSRLKSNEPDDADAGDGSGDGEGKPKKKRWGLRIGIAIAVALVVALAVCAAVFSWDRWMRYDDAADMQGTWYAYGTSVPVTFEDGKIVFEANTAYSYEIDPDAKTIDYQIGDLEGQGRYWFSDDRGTLVITDGGDFTKWGNVWDDVAFRLHCLFNGASVPITDKSIAFSRVAMNDGLLTAPEPEPEPVPAPEPQSSSSSAEPEPEQPAEQQGEPEGDARDAKEDMKQMPISDIIVEDNTPTWGEESNG